MENTEMDTFIGICDTTGLLLSKDELLDIEQDIEWGKFIYEQHTRNGTASITPEIAVSFSLRDIECLVIFAMLQIIESKITSVLSLTLAVCIKELERRET